MEDSDKVCMLPDKYTTFRDISGRCQLQQSDKRSSTNVKHSCTSNDLKESSKTGKDWIVLGSKYSIKKGQKIQAPFSKQQLAKTLRFADGELAGSTKFLSRHPQIMVQSPLISLLWIVCIANV